MMTSINDLEKMIKTPTDKLLFSDDQIIFMQNNLGNLNSHIRDDLVFNLFGIGFMENRFTKHQEDMIVNKFLKDKNIFKKIDYSLNNDVFLRSFNALLGAIIMKKDSYTSLLNEEQRNIFLKWSVKYLSLESDYRGFVPEYGWAHGIAHGSDFLSNCFQNHKTKFQNQNQILELVETIIKKVQTPFMDGEESRLAAAIFEGVNNAKISVHNFNKFIITFDKQLWQNYHDKNLESFYQLNIWINILTPWFFFFTNFSEIQNTLKQLIQKYYRYEGFIE